MPLNTAVSVTDYLKSKGRQSSFSERGKLYAQSGLNKRLGNYIGSGQQNTKLLDYARGQFDQPTGQAPQSLVNQFQNIKQQAGGLQTQAVQQFGATPTIPRGPTAGLEATGPPQKLPQLTSKNDLDQLAQWKSEGNAFFKEGSWWFGKNPDPTTTEQAPGSVIDPTAQYEFTPSQLSDMEGVDKNEKEEIQQAMSQLQNKEITLEEYRHKVSRYGGFAEPQTTKDAEPSAPGTTGSPTEGKTVAKQVALQDTDIGNIVQQLTTGEIKDLDVEVAQEAKRLAVEGEERRAEGAMKQIQQSLARSGMTFSGIRTKAEENAVATSLAQKAGISNKFALSLISAARQEQARRETANAAAAKASTSALEAMGYVQVGGELFPTLSREKFEEGDEAGAPKTFGSASTGYFQWNEETKQYEKIVDPKPESPQKPTSRERFETEAQPHFTGIRTRFSQSRNAEGYVNTETYLTARNGFLQAFPTRANEFDNAFASFLSTADRKKLGVGKSPSISFEDIFFSGGGGTEAGGWDYTQ